MERGVQPSEEVVDAPRRQDARVLRRQRHKSEVIPAIVLGDGQCLLHGLRSLFGPAPTAPQCRGGSGRVDARGAHRITTRGDQGHRVGS